MGLNISLADIAFTAMSANTINRTDNELRNEQIVTKGMQEIASNVNYMTTEKNNLVAFNDPVNGKIAIVSLSSATMDKLKAHFGENDFYQRDDGITRLDNKAEAFVGGWFGDIAYKREFLSADQNQDGKLNSSEYLNTKNGFSGDGVVTLNYITGDASIEGKIDKSYEKVGDVTSNIGHYNQKNQSVNIDEELNTTLRIDKDFNSKISLSESFRRDIKRDNLSDTEVAIKDVEDEHSFMIGKLNSFRNNVHKKVIRQQDVSVNIDTDKQQDELLKKQQALAKLMQNNGDASKLSAEERSFLSGELSQYKKKDGTHTVNMDILKKLDKQLKEENDINIKLDKALTKALDENITQKAEINMKEKDEQSKKTSAIGTLIQNGGDVDKLTQEDKALIKYEIEHSKSSDGNIDIDKLKHIQKHQRAKKNYTAVDIQTPNLYVQKG